MLPLTPLGQHLMSTITTIMGIIANTIPTRREDIIIITTTTITNNNWTTTLWVVVTMVITIITVQVRTLAREVMGHQATIVAAVAVKSINPRALTTTMAIWSPEHCATARSTAS